MEHCIEPSSHFRADIDAAEHGVPGGRAVAAGPRHLRLLALHRLPRLKRLRPQPPRHQVSSTDRALGCVLSEGGFTQPRTPSVCKQCRTLLLPFQLRPLLLRDAAAHLPRQQNHEEGRAHGKRLAPNEGMKAIHFQSATGRCRGIITNRTLPNCRLRECCREGRPSLNI